MTATGNKKPGNKLALREPGRVERSANRDSEPDEKADALFKEVFSRIPVATGIKRRLIADQIIALAAQCFVVPGDSLPRRHAEPLATAVEAFEELAPKNFVEAMLAGQMVNVNQMAQRFLGKSLADGQPSEFIDANVLRATRLMRVFMEQVELLQRLRGNVGQQRVVVEHVNVHDGGQAIVGTVTAKGPGEGVGAGAENSGNTP
jgi:hypothetical protein